MNIDGIGEETAALLFSSGLVENIADLYDLTVEKLTGLEGIAQKGAERIIEGINRSRTAPFERFVYALSIPFVGETTAKKIAQSARNINRLMSMTKPELEGIDTVGSKIADAIIEYFAAPVNRDIIRRLKEAGVVMEMPETDPATLSDALKGQTFVISGVFALHSRDEYKKMIEQNGGKNSGSISKKTDYVLAGENMGPAKLEKANSLGIPIIDETQFLAMVNPTPTEEFMGADPYADPDPTLKVSSDPTPSLFD